MGEADRIKFLGTAGARYVMARQLRSSAGTLLHLGGKNVVLDPGPGTLARCAACRPKMDVTTLDAVIITHAHIDHSNDASVLIDAMTEGGTKKRGAVFAPAQCLDGPSAILFSYLRGFPRQVTPLEARARYELDGLEFSTSQRHRHGVETYGIRFHRPAGDVAFVVDTAYFEALAESYKGSKVAVINVVLHKQDQSGRILHLSLPEAERLIREIEPRKAVLTHFGMTMIRAKPWELAAEMSQRLGIEVTAASDGRTIELNG